MKRRVRRGAFGLILIAGMTTAADLAHATTVGVVEVGVNRLAGQPASQTFTLPPGAIVAATPVANLAAVLPWVDGSEGLRALALASGAIDIPNGAISGTISTFSRMEVPGIASRGYASASIGFTDVFDVRSDVLAAGTAVDVRIELMIAFMGSAGVTGVGTCCSIRSVFDWRLAAGSSDSSYVPISPTGFRGVLAGGLNGAPVELSLGSYVAEAAVGIPFFLEVDFGIESEALASAVVLQGIHHAGQSEAAGTAVLLFATEVTPAAAALSAAARAPSASAYLYSTTGGFALPGLEALDASNVSAHLGSLVPLPEPGTFVLVAAGLAGLGALRPAPSRRRATRSSPMQSRCTPD